jgi:predicted alpha/beta-hydrolase family hydrolase
MGRMARELSETGLLVATFDFPYMIAGRKAPDKAPVLERAWRDVIGAARASAPFMDVPLFIGGKSMGGRMASNVAAQGIEQVRGLVLLGYPLHPPGRPQQRRDAHLAAIREAMLFVQGERDDFGSAAEIEELLPQLNPNTTLHVVEAGDHSFKVPARSGKRPDDVFRDIVRVVSEWIRRISEGP